MSGIAAKGSFHVLQNDLETNGPGGVRFLLIASLCCFLTDSAFQMPLLRKGAITNSHGHVSFMAKRINNLHALPHRDLVESIVLPKCPLL